MKKNSKNLLIFFIIGFVFVLFSTVSAGYNLSQRRWTGRDLEEIELRNKQIKEEQKKMGMEAWKAAQELKREKYKKETEKYFQASEKAYRDKENLKKQDLFAKQLRETPDQKNIEEKTQSAVQASENLKDKVEEVQTVIKDFFGFSFEEQCKTKLNSLERNPNSLKLQLDMCDILMDYTNRLHNSFEITDKANLGDLRNKVVQGFKTISELKAAEAQEYQGKANQTQGIWKNRYEQLSTVCLNFSKAYDLRAKDYQKIPMNDQINEVRFSMEYLNDVKNVLVSLREFIENIQADEETLKQLKDTQKALSNLQKSLLNFSEVVLDGAFHAGEELVEVTK